MTVIEVATGAVRATLPPFADRVERLAFTPDGTRLAVVADGPLRRMTALAPGERPTPSVVPGKV